MTEKYRLVGIMNMFKIVPDLVMPIFEKDNNYYFEIGDEETLTITEFAPVKESAVVHIILFDKIKNNLTETKELTVDDNPIFAYQTSEDYVFIGTFEEVGDYATRLKSQNVLISDDLKDLLYNL